MVSSISVLIFSTIFFLFPVLDAMGDCDLCPDIRLESTDGLAEEYPRYLGVWSKQGEWEGKAFYMCFDDCQGLREQMIYYEGAWRIVDCRPGETTACGGSHTLIKSQSMPITSCPYDNLGPWSYCPGDISPVIGCTVPLETDFTAMFVCVNSTTH